MKLLCATNVVVGVHMHIVRCKDQSKSEIGVPIIPVVFDVLLYDMLDYEVLV